MDVTDPSKPSTSPFPQGYRQGLVTAITVFLGFSLSFLRFWGIESPGHWTWKGVACACFSALAFSSNSGRCFDLLNFAMMKRLDTPAQCAGSLEVRRL